MFVGNLSFFLAVFPVVNVNVVVVAVFPLVGGGDGVVGGVAVGVEL